MLAEYVPHVLLTSFSILSLSHMYCSYSPSPRMDSLKGIVGMATKRMRNDALCSSVVFPRTDSLKKDDPACTLSYKSITSGIYEQVNKEVEVHPELISLNAVDDVQLVLTTLKEVHETLHLESFDMIQIYRGGVDLLRLVNESRHVNRSAYIEINQYRRSIQQFLHPQHNTQSWLSIIVTAVVSAVSVVCAQQLFQGSKKE